nr:hypothetical protein BaRGS_009657 [Batillaria attramentaria]
MFIVSQLNFSHYLSKASFDAAAAGAALLPRPVDLSRDYRRGDFDVLLIHPHLGILIAEVKSVGSNLADVLSKTEEQRDSDVTKRVKRAIKQLDKSEVVMKHMVSDITPDLVVKKTLILPYVTSAQLQRVLQADTNLEKVRTLGEAVSECGERLVRIVLTPAQLDLLNRAPDVVYLTGPPGTGKTLVLILIGLVWLRQGHDVHVASTRGANLAASQLIYHQLQMTLKADASSALGDLGTVYLHQFDLFTGVERPVETLVSASESNGDGLHVLIDEADIIGRES